MLLKRLKELIDDGTLELEPCTETCTVTVRFKILDMRFKCQFDDHNDGLYAFWAEDPVTLFEKLQGLREF